MPEQDPNRSDPIRPLPKAPAEAATAPPAVGTTPAQGLSGTEEERVRAEAQNAAQAKVQEQRDQALRDEEARQANRQRELDAAVATDQANSEPPTKVGDGGVDVQYLGTSDEFDFGAASDDDRRHVVAQAGGSAVSIPQDLFDRVNQLPFDQFIEVKS